MIKDYNNFARGSVQFGFVASSHKIILQETLFDFTEEGTISPSHLKKLNDLKNQALSNTQKFFTVDYITMGNDDAFSKSFKKTIADLNTGQVCEMPDFIEERHK